MNDSRTMMDFSDYPKEIDLLDGSKAWLRPMEKGDKNPCIVFFKRSPRVTAVISNTMCQKKETIANWCAALDYDLVLPIIAVTSLDKKAEIVGNATLHTERHGWSTHVARIRVQVSPSVRRNGMGRFLMQELCDRAVRRGIDKVQFHVRADNLEAINLLKKLNFTQEGVFRNHAIDSMGKRHDLLIFYEDLSDLWKKMEDLNLDLDITIWP